MPYQLLWPLYSAHFKFYLSSHYVYLALSLASKVKNNSLKKRKKKDIRQTSENGFMRTQAQSADCVCLWSLWCCNLTCGSTLTPTHRRTKLFSFQASGNLGRCFSLDTRTCMSSNVGWFPASAWKAIWYSGTDSPRGKAGANRTCQITFMQQNYTETMDVLSYFLLLCCLMAF